MSLNSNPHEYPFEYIDTKQEVRPLYEQSYNEMQLFSCGDEPDMEELKAFCEAKRKTIINGYWHVITFFDRPENAAFTKLPITSMYSDVKEFAGHIKAVYTFNTANKYSRLVVYKPNQWSGKAIEVDID